MSNPRQIQQAVASYLATFEADTVPAGWHTLKALSKAYGTGHRNVALIMSRLKKHGQVEVRDFKCMTGHGIQRIPHYKLSPAAAKAFGLK